MNKISYPTLHKNGIDFGGVPKWLKGAVLKTVRSLTAARGFESHPLRELTRG